MLDSCCRGLSRRLLSRSPEASSVVNRIEKIKIVGAFHEKQRQGKPRSPRRADV